MTRRSQGRPGDRVVHLTSVHHPSDTRIFERECRTLARQGYEVVLVATGSGSTDTDEVRLRLVPRPRSRLARMTATTWRVYRAARSERASIYHFHDLELLPTALALRLHGARIVYDAHEDLGGEVHTKEWIPRPLRRGVAPVVALLERVAGLAADAVIAATPAIARRYAAAKTTVVQNFPPLASLHRPATEAPGGNAAVYVGDIRVVRGARTMVEAMATVRTTGAKLLLAGRFTPPELEAELRGDPGWEKVDYLGWVSRDQVPPLLGRARVGLLVFHPAPNHLESQPNKLFEYMSAGLPVVASDFPLWRDIVSTTGCGLLVDPQDPRAVADAITFLLDHPDEAAEMGARGRHAVEARFNWEAEAVTLLETYASLLDRSGAPRRR